MNGDHSSYVLNGNTLVFLLPIPLDVLDFPAIEPCSAELGILTSTEPRKLNDAEVDAAVVAQLLLLLPNLKRKAVSGCAWMGDAINAFTKILTSRRIIDPQSNVLRKLIAIEACHDGADAESLGFLYFSGVVRWSKD